jgi:hypothetical protein
MNYNFARPGYGPNIYLNKIFEEEEMVENQRR